MDADAMYPEGFHPLRIMYKADYSGYATHIPRSVAGVKYYFIDFGISVHIPKDIGSKFVVGNLGRDQTPPELSATVPYDAFKLDVYILGNMFKCELTDVRIPLPSPLPHLVVLIALKKFTNLEFLIPLVEIMVQEVPRHRPSAQEALDRWREIKKTIGTIHGEWRPRSVGEDPCERFTLDIVSLYQLFMYFARAFVESVAETVTG